MRSADRLVGTLLLSILLSACGSSGSGGSGGSGDPPPAVAPSITTQPTDQIVTEGQSATFTVAASGTTPLTYQWVDNGSSIPGATSPTYTTPATASAQDGDHYTVVVSNVSGKVASSAAILTINTAPAITSQPASQSVMSGSRQRSP